MYNYNNNSINIYKYICEECICICTAFLYNRLFIIDDGRVNPVDATIAFSKGAKSRGVKYYEGVEVKQVLEQVKFGQRSVSGVQTVDGHVIKADYVINSAGE